MSEYRNASGFPPRVLFAFVSKAVPEPPPSRVVAAVENAAAALGEAKAGKRGRPQKLGGALTNAERQAAYRARQKAELGGGGA